MSEKSALILGMIATGRSYAQIVDGGEDVRYHDIFTAAEDALRLSGTIEGLLRGGDLAGKLMLAAIRERHPNAWEPWTLEDDEELRRLSEAGMSTARLAERFGRRPGAIASRLRKFGLA